MIFVCSLGIYLYDVIVAKLRANIERNRLEIKELPERKIGEKKKQNRLIPRLVSRIVSARETGLM